MGILLKILVVATFLAPCVWAANKPAAEAAAPLSEFGEKLEAQYAGQLEALKTRISEAIPALDPQKKSAYQSARESESAAKLALEAAQKRHGEIGTARALVAHAKGKWIGGADKGIAAAKAKLKTAKTDAERQAAQEELVKWEKNREDGLHALKERQAVLDRLEGEQSQIEKDLKAAQEAVVQAKEQSVEAIENFGLTALLSSDKLDAQLAGYVILMEATPRGLAAFAQQGEGPQELVELMFSDEELLVQMAIADGANGGQYGRAMQIYRDILNVSRHASEGSLQRLALAISLEHAVPVKRRNAVADTDAPETVDPVKRYQHFEKAFLAGELDPGFKNLSVWEYRMVVDGEEPDEILSWGREMLRNYRPDQVTKPDYRWRYVEIVRSDIRYGSQDNQYDKDELQFFQNILMNGGICGRRAFFGRFILRAFGIPTTARPQRGHAALVHWTPDGWVPCLGAGWGSGWTKTRYDKDLDFLANTQARALGDAFMQVKRAQWIGDVMGERRTFGFLSGEPDFWYGVSLDIQRGLIAAAKSKTLDAVGQDIAEANETKEVIEIAKVTIRDEEREVRTDENGVITIPAAATSKPTQSTGKIIFMESALGGKQMHYSRNGGKQNFEYRFDVPAAGRYAISARVVTPSWKQSLLVTANELGQAVELALPFTVGLWETSPPVEIDLVKGKNVLRFTHQSDGYEKGFSIKDFTLTPVR